MELSTNLSFKELSTLNTWLALPQQEECREYDSQAVIDFMRKNPEECMDIIDEILPE